MKRALAVAFVCLIATVAYAQTPSEQAVNDRMRAAEDALEKHDEHTAEPILEQLTHDRPKDPHIFYNLGLIEQHHNEIPKAEAFFKAAITLDPSYAEAHDALGLAYAARNKEADACAEWGRVVALPSASPALRGTDLRILAELDMGSGDFSKANNEILHAIELTGERFGDADMAGALALAAKDYPAAEKQFTQAVAEDPSNPRKRVALAEALERERKYSDAEQTLTVGLTEHPDDLALNTTMAQTYVDAGDVAKALTFLKAFLDTNMSSRENYGVKALLARLYNLNDRPADAEPLDRAVAEAWKNDPSVLDSLGGDLVRERKYAEAEAVLAHAVSQREAFHDDQAWAEAASHLAFAASKAGHPQVTLHALDARATVLPNSGSSLFLRATANDSLHLRKQAIESYKAFLGAAAGKFPDEEFQARHRLVALQHEQ